MMAKSTKKAYCVDFYRRSTVQTPPLSRDEARKVAKKINKVAIGGNTAKIRKYR
jgi:hypothetical protein